LVDWVGFVSVIGAALFVTVLLVFLVPVEADRARRMMPPRKSRKPPQSESDSEDKSTR
jgi:hypothetical protein